MKNSLIVLTILFGMNYVSFLHFVWNVLSGGIKHFVSNELTDKFQGPHSSSEFFE